MSSTTVSAPAFKGGRSVTLKDVAALAGVSTMSVSAVLNGGGRGMRQVSPEARARILRSAEELGYRRNSFAAATAKGRFGNIALLTSPRPWRSYTPHGLLEGIQSALIEQDLHLMLASLSDDLLTDENFVPKILREWMTDGLIINYIQDIPKRLIDIIERHQIPAIWTNSKRKYDCVRPDDERAGREATEHLLSLGHTRIAFVDYAHTDQFANEHYSAGDRWNGYQKAMRAAGLEPRALRSKGQVVSALEFTQQWLGDAQRPTAVIAYASEVTPIMAVCLQLGLQVPEDLSLVTFGSEQTTFVYRPITTLVVPEKAMGRTAVNLLIQKIGNSSTSLDPQVLPFELVQGTTVAPVRHTP